MKLLKDFPEVLKCWDYEKNNQKGMTPETYSSCSNKKFFWKCLTCNFEWMGTIKKTVKHYKKHNSPCMECIKTEQSIYTKFPQIVNYLNFNYEDIETIIETLQNTSVISKNIFLFKCPTCRKNWRDYADNLRLVQLEDGTLCHKNCNETTHNYNYSDIYPNLEAIYVGDFSKLNLTTNISTVQKWCCNKCGVNFKLTIDKLLNRISRTGAYCSNCHASFDTPLPISSKACPLTFLTNEYFLEWSPLNTIQSNQVDVLSNIELLWDCAKCSGTYSCTPIDKKTFTCPYCDNKEMLKGFNTLEVKYPQLKVFWNSSNPKTFADYWEFSKEQLRWNCPCCSIQFSCSPAELVAKISKISFDSMTCPNFCDWSTKVLVYRTFADKPILLHEWSKKNDVLPQNALHHIDTKKYWWDCSICYGEYLCSIPIRREVDNTCPYCNMEMLKPDFNSIGCNYPDLNQYWSYSNQKTTDEMMPTRARNVNCYLFCPECDQEFRTTMMNLFDKYDKKGIPSLCELCPYCTKQLPIPGVNTLDVVKPYLVKEWRACNNKKVSEVFPNYNRNAYWECRKCKGNFRASPNERFENDSCCPYCSGKALLNGFNDLATLYPQFKAEWSNKNNEPYNNFTPYEKKVVFWKCDKCDGEYNERICERVKPDYECPYCSGRKCLAGFNTIDTTHPELIKEWDYLNNMLLADPTQLRDTSRIKVWWICQNNSEHRYKLPINKRILFEKRGRVPCSICKGLRRKREHYAQYKK